MTDSEAIGFFIERMEDLRDTKLAAEDPSGIPDLSGFDTSCVAFEGAVTAATLVTAGAAGFALRPHSQLVTEFAALGFSVVCRAGASLACAAIKVASALEPPPARAG